MTSPEPFYFFPYGARFGSSLFVNGFDVSKSPALNSTVSGISMGQADERYLPLHPVTATISDVVGDNSYYTSFTAGTLNASTATFSSLAIDSGGAIKGPLSVEKGAFTALTSDGIAVTAQTVQDLKVTGKAIFSGAETHTGAVAFGSEILAVDGSFTALTASSLHLGILAGNSATFGTGLTTADLCVSDKTILAGGTTLSGAVMMDSALVGATATFDHIITKGTLTAPGASLGTVSATAMSVENASFNSITATGLKLDGPVEGDAASFALVSSAGVAAATGSVGSLKVGGTLSAASASFSSISASSLSVKDLFSSTFTTPGLVVTGPALVSGVLQVDGGARVTDLVASSATTLGLVVSGNGIVSGGLTVGGTLTGANATISNLFTSTHSSTGLAAGSATVGGMLVSNNALIASRGLTVSGEMLAGNATLGLITTAGIFCGSGNNTIGALCVNLLGVNNGITAAGLVATYATATNLVVTNNSTVGSLFASSLTATGLVGNSVNAGTITTAGLLVTSGGSLITGGVYPILDAMSDLGSTAKRYNNLNCLNLNTSGTSNTYIGNTTGNLTVNGGALNIYAPTSLLADITPSTNNVCKLGSTSSAFSEMFAYKINSTNQTTTYIGNTSGSISLNGAVSCLGDLSVAGRLPVNFLSLWFYSLSIPTNVDTVISGTPKAADTLGGTPVVYSSNGRYTNSTNRTLVVDVSCSCNFPLSSTGVRATYLCINGAPPFRPYAMMQTTATNFSSVGFTTKFILSAASYFMIYVLQTSGVTLTCGVNSDYPVIVSVLSY